MSETVTHLVFWLLAAVSIVSAAGVVLVRDVMRMALSLGAFLLSVAAWFLFFGQTFLAVAQVFVYLGGVLVLVLFAIMLVHRSAGDPELTSRHSFDAALVAGGIFIIVVMTMRPVANMLGGEPSAVTPEMVAQTFLGPMLPHFEALAVLLLAALVAAIAVAGGERE